MHNNQKLNIKKEKSTLLEIPAKADRSLHHVSEVRVL